MVEALSAGSVSLRDRLARIQSQHPNDLLNFSKVELVVKSDDLNTFRVYLDQARKDDWARISASYNTVKGTAKISLANYDPAALQSHAILSHIESNDFEIINASASYTKSSDKGSSLYTKLI